MVKICQETTQIRTAHCISIPFHASLPPRFQLNAHRSQTTTTTTTLASRAVGWRGRDVLDSSDSHARTSQRTQSRLGTGTRGLGAVTTSGADLDVEGGDAEFLASLSDVLRGQHGCVRGGFVTVSLDLHASGDTADGFAATGKITQC